MLAIGIVNITLFIVGLYSLISSGWQFTERSRNGRIKLSSICWLTGSVIGVTAYIGKCGV